MKFVTSVREMLFKREWANKANLRGRIGGERAFPIKVSLGAPTGFEAGDSPDVFHRFQRDWQDVSHVDIEWKTIKYRSIGEQRVPYAMRIHRFSDLVSFLGQDCSNEAARWAQIISSVESWHSGSKATLSNYLPLPEEWTPELVDKALSVVKLIKPGMGEGGFVRSLVFPGVDTKFVESNEKLLTVLCACKWGEAVQEDGLLPWLGAIGKPEHNIIVRLAGDLSNLFGGMPHFKADWRTVNRLSRFEPRIVLIVENAESVFVPDLPQGMVIVGGGGNNLAWMRDCAWLESADKVGYWGDMDMHGLVMLESAKRFYSRTEPVLMSGNLVREHRARLVVDPTGFINSTNFFDSEILDCVKALSDEEGTNYRLEQERLPGEVIANGISEWLCR
ncbi:hypothetical protein E4634_16260 [Mangrovimicrobium sediminis]|uniref:DUF3322 and DUF2220 domain-containing protein n=1 Tax=Mangrovimicrobium sediminis TaxID=2562682 RepID=A0A4Z0LY53_9GAMM|nr:DUF3322 domain-containing protein [Haliea sp. SAOS-164]TGD72219.1 hypothetical protein E4634_16260 [Haliea sp. SAOS-164]